MSDAHCRHMHTLLITCHAVSALNLAPKSNLPPRLYGVTLKFFFPPFFFLDKILIHIRATSSWHRELSCTLYSTEREREKHAATILYPTHDKQLILIYASPSLSHIKLRLHYGRWQVKRSKPDGIWRRPRDVSAEVLPFSAGRSPIRCKLTPSPPNHCCGGKKADYTVAKSGWGVEGRALPTLPSIDGDVATNVGCFFSRLAAKPRSIESRPAATARSCFHEGGKVGVNPGLKTPPWKMGIRRVNRLGDSE